jgi:hypothetical protein
MNLTRRESFEEYFMRRLDDLVDWQVNLAVSGQPNAPNYKTSFDVYFFKLV